MKWEEVRRIYPNQFVKFKILGYHIVENVRIVYDIAIIRAMKDNKEATKELVRSTGNEMVYHKSNNDIEIEIRDIRKYR